MDDKQGASDPKVIALPISISPVMRVYYVACIDFAAGNMLFGKMYFLPFMGEAIADLEVISLPDLAPKSRPTNPFDRFRAWRDSGRSRSWGAIGVRGGRTSRRRRRETNADTPKPQDD